MNRMAINQTATGAHILQHTHWYLLLQEAYKMVDEAKGGKVSAEKKLADAAGKVHVRTHHTHTRTHTHTHTHTQCIYLIKYESSFVTTLSCVNECPYQIDAMETEMSTLKQLIQSSQPQPSPKSRSNTLSLPVTHSPHKQRRPSIKRAVRKIQKRTGIGMPRTPSSSSKAAKGGAPLVLVEHKSGVKGESLVTGEVSDGRCGGVTIDVHFPLSLSPLPPSPSPSLSLSLSLLSLLSPCSLSLIPSLSLPPLSPVPSL